MMLVRIGRNGVRKGVRQLSALRSFEEDYEEGVKELAGLSQSSKIESSTLPNGVEVISTGAAAGSVIGVKLSGVGSADGSHSAAYAASIMAFKSGNGVSDLATQRPLELAGLVPHAKILKSSMVLALQGTPERAEMAMTAAALAIGVDRDSYVDWEFIETMKAANFVPPGIDACIEAAAFGEGSFLARPLVSARGLEALHQSSVEALVSAAIDHQPLTVIAVGLDHADAIATAAKAFGSLGPRSKAVDLPSQFIPGGFAAKNSSSVSTCAAALPADSLLAGVLACALSPPPGVTLEATESGLLVAKGPTSKQSLIKLLSTDIDALSPDAFATAKLQYKTQLLAKSSLDLAFAIADGSYLALTQLDSLTLDAARDKVKGTEPAFAVIAPSDD